MGAPPLNSRVRGDCHLLLVGDPGTGKSQLMKCAGRLSARAVLTTGKGTSGAGLTAAAVKDGGQWALEAGALVLADGGLCCIDEFGGIREADRAGLHEAMEQQTVSIAKAGLVVKLNTRAAVLAIMNPQPGLRVDPSEDISSATGLPGPLLSRFDMVLRVRDPRDEAHDRRVSSHVLGIGDEAGPSDATGGQDGGSSGGGDTCRALAALGSGPEPSELWTRDSLALYVAHCRAAPRPEISREAERLLSAYYQLQRGRANPIGRPVGRTTIRMLESLVRVAQAHARLLCRRVVALQDAIVSIVLSEASTQTSEILGSMDRFQNFPERADSEYAILEEQVLRTLQPALDSLGPEFAPPLSGGEDDPVEIPGITSLGTAGARAQSGSPDPNNEVAPLPLPFERFVDVENIEPNVALAPGGPGGLFLARPPSKRSEPTDGFDEPEPRETAVESGPRAHTQARWEDADDLALDDF